MKTEQLLLYCLLVSVQQTPMKNKYTLTKENFENLLRWLSADRDEAGKKYEEIRDGLIRFFRFRGCADPLALADETINRIALKIPVEETEMEKFSINYIYGFAVNVHHEYVRLNANKEVEINLNLPFETARSKEFSNFSDEGNGHIDCLQHCLENMPSEESALLIKYYSEEKSAKFDLRKQMAEKLKITTRALHTKVFRLKNKMKKCIENCINKKNL